MPEKFRHGALALLAACLIGPTAAIAQSPLVTQPRSELDAPLLYQLLIGELELRDGQPGAAYQLLLDAARRTQDEGLFKRVVQIAVQARAGDQALIAAKAWREAVPRSIEAQQTTIQLLVALNRAPETVEPLRALLALTPVEQRPNLLSGLPRLFQRASEPKRVHAAMVPLLQANAAAGEPVPQRAMALAVQGRLALTAGEPGQALTLARETLALAPDSDDAMQLALDAMPTHPEAEALIRARLERQADAHALRIAYGRALARAQRPADAAREFRLVTEQAPTTSMAWFALGTLELELRHFDATDKALREYLRQTEPVSDGGATPTLDAQINETRQQSWLMLAQAAEQRGDLKAAEAWLVKIDAPQRQLEAKYRRASLLARQGKLAQARALLQPAEGESDSDVRTKLMAESQLLREAREWKAAHALLERANTRFDADVDLLYEQSMMAEKLGRLEEMEVLLKRVIAIKPDHHHAYNALGYSLAERNVRLPEARDLVAKALSYAPTEPFIVDSMGWVEYRLGNLAEAVKLLRQAYGSRPDAEIAAHLGEVLWISGERDEARRVWQEAAKRDPKNEALRETLDRLKVKL